MSKQIDERVVQMEFDNKNFERNVSESLSTLDKLKRALRLDGAAKGLEEVDNATKKIDMSPLQKGVESVSEKFTAMEIVAITALQRVTNQVITTGENLIKSLSIDQITSGWSKYAEKTASVQTIMNSTGKSIDEVNEYLSKLMWYSDETSYGFTDMTKALGQMTSAGGDIDNIIPMIMGIANATAFAGKGASEFSHIMYNLNQSYASGALTLMDWRSVELMGAGSQQLKQTLIDTAVELGKIEEGMVTVANFSTTLSDKWADQEVMEKGFGKFAVMMEDAYDLVQAGKFDTASEALESLTGKYDNYIERATKSAQEAKTFAEALDATKDAVSSGWMETFEIIFGNYEQSKELWTELANTLWDVFAAGAEGRNDLLREALGGEANWNSLSEKIKDTGINLDDFQEKLIETGKEHGVITDEMIKEAGSFEESLKSGWLTGDIFSETIGKYADGADGFVQSTQSMEDKLSDFQKVFDDVWNGKYGNGADRIKALTDAGYDYAEVQNLVNEHTIGYKLTLDDLTDVELESIGYTEDQIKAMRELQAEASSTGSSVSELIEKMSKPTGRELLIDTMRNALTGLIKILDTVKRSWSNVFPSATATDIYNLVNRVHDLSQSLILSDENAGKLEETFDGLFSIVKTITKLLGGSFKAAVKIVNSFLKELNFGVLDVTASIGRNISAFNNWIQANTHVSSAFSSLVNVLSNAAATLGRWLSQAKDWITSNEKINTSIGKIITALGKIVNKLFDFISAILKTEIVQNGLSKAFEFFGEVVEKVIEMLGNSAEKVGDFVESFNGMESANSIISGVVGKISELTRAVGGLDGFTLDNVVKIFSSFRDNVIDAFFETDLSITSFSDKFKLFKTNVTKEVKNVGDRFLWLKDGVMGFLDLAREKIPSVLALGGAAILIKTLNSIATAMTALADPINILKNAMNSLTSTFKAIGKAVSFNQQASGILKIAAAVGILAYSLYQLASVNQSNLWSSVGALSAIVGVVGAFSILLGVLDKLGKIGSLSSSGRGLLTISASLLILSTALRQMEGMDFVSGVKNAILLGLLAAALVEATSLLGKLNKGSSWVGGANVLAISGALFILATSLGVLAKMDIADITQGVVAMVALVGVLSILSKSMNGIKFGNGAGLIAMALGIKLFLGVFEEILEIPFEKLQNGLGSLFGIMLSLIALCGVMRLAGSNAMNAGAGMILISAALLIMVKAVTQLSELGPEKIQTATESIVALLAMFAVLTAVSKLAGENATKAGMMLMQMSAALLIVVGVIYLLTGIDDTAALARSVAVVAVLEILFGGLIAVSHFAKDVGGTIVTLTIAIAAISAIVMIFTMLASTNKEGLTLATEVMATLMTTLSLLVLSTKVLESVKLGNVLGTFAILTAVLAAISLIVYKLASMETGPSMETVASISILLTALSASVLIISKAGHVSESAIAATYTLLGAVVAIGALLQFLAEMDVGPSIETAISISILLVAMSAVVAILSKIGPMAANAVTAAAAFDAVVGLIGGLMLGIGALMAYVPECEDFLDKGIEVLIKIAEGLGTFIGTFVANLLDASLSKLDSTAERLNTFMDKLQPFLEKVKGIKDEDIKGVKSLVNLFSELSGASFQENINVIGDSILGAFGKETGIEKFANDLIAIADAVTGFQEKLTENGANYDEIEKSVNAVAALAGLSDLIQPSGIIPTLVGTKDLGNFGEQLKGLGEGIAEYAKAIAFKGITKEGIQPSIDAIASLATLQDCISTSGIIPTIIGMKDLGNFGEQLKGLGEGIAAFYDSVDGKDISVDAVQGSVDAISSLAGLQDVISVSGVIPTIIGTKDLGNFGEQLGGLGEGIAAYTKAIAFKGITKEGLQPSIDAIASLAALQDVIAPTGIIQNIIGAKDLSAFGGQLGNLGSGIASYYDSISDKGITDETIQPSIRALASLAELQGLIAPSGFVQAIIGGPDLSNFGNQLGELGEGIAAYAKAIAFRGITKESIQPSVDALTSLAGLQDIVAPSGFIQSIVGGPDLSSFGSQLEGLGTGLATFASSVSGENRIDLESINIAIQAAELITSLSDILPRIQGIFGIQQENTSISELGHQLENFGIYFKSFNDNIKDIDSEQVVAICDSIEHLGETLRSISDIDSNIGSNFVNNMKSLASLSVEGIAETFESAGETLSASVSSMIDSISATIYSKQEDIQLSATNMMIFFSQAINASAPTVNVSVIYVITMMLTIITSYQPQFQNQGLMLMVMLSVGIQTGTIFVTAAVLTMLTTEINLLQSYYPMFNECGVTFMVNVANGISSQEGTVIDAASAIMSSCVDAVKSFQPSFHSAGGYLADGLIQGILAKKEEVYKAAFELGQAAVQGEKDGQQSNSPSKATIKAGGWLAEGLIIGMNLMQGSVYDSGYSIGENAVDAMSDAMQKVSDVFDGLSDYQPTIRPVVDLSDVKRGSSAINGMFGSTGYMDLSGSIIKANSIARIVEDNQNGKTSVSSGGNFEFNQYNYSPKALSRLDIYRQTKNQFARIKEVVNKR